MVGGLIFSGLSPCPTIEAPIVHDLYNSQKADPLMVNLPSYPSSADIILREGGQFPSPDVVCPQLHRYRANDSQGMWTLSALSAVVAPAWSTPFYLLSVSAWSSNNEMNSQQRQKRLREHFCETKDCSCYQCSMCSRRTVYKRAFVKHQQFSERLLWGVKDFFEKRRKT